MTAVSDNVARFGNCPKHGPYLVSCGECGSELTQRILDGRRCYVLLDFDRTVFLGMNACPALSEGEPEHARRFDANSARWIEHCNVLEMACGGVYGIPEVHTEDQVRDALRGAVESVRKVRDSAPCDEHRQAIDEASDLLRGVAQEIEDVNR